MIPRRVFVSLLALSACAIAQQPAPLVMTHTLRPTVSQWMVARDQGNRNTCDAFTLAQVIEYEKHVKGEHVQLSPEFLYWAGGEVTNSRGSRDGYSTATYLAAIAKYGICSETLMPYGQKGAPRKEALADALTRQNVKAKLLTKPCLYAGVGKGFTQREIDNICDALKEGHPVLVDTQFPETPKLDQFKILQLRDNRRMRGLGHTMMAVGYRADGKEGAFEFLNTFGTAYGDSGYIYVTFEFLRQKGAQAIYLEIP